MWIKIDGDAYNTKYFSKLTKIKCDLCDTSPTKGQYYFNLWVEKYTIEFNSMDKGALETTYKNLSYYLTLPDYTAPYEMPEFISK